jgi:hypothetical protein
MYETGSYNGSKKAELYGHLLQSIESQFGNKGETSLFHDWVKGVILDGRPFSFNRHEYLIEPYKDDHPHQVEEKALS